MTTVEISQEDKDTARRLAKQRNGRNWSRNFGIKPENTHYVGLLGEIAFAKYYDMDIDSKFRTFGDNGVDFVISRGLETIKLDVKTTSNFMNPKLYVRTENEHSPDMYYLVGVCDTHARLVGWVRRKEIIETEPEKSKYGHYNYTKKYGELNDPFDAGEINQVVS